MVKRWAFSWTSLYSTRANHILFLFYAAKFNVINVTEDNIINIYIPTLLLCNNTEEIYKLSMLGNGY